MIIIIVIVVIRMALEEGNAKTKCWDHKQSNNWMTCPRGIICILTSSADFGFELEWDDSPASVPSRLEILSLMEGVEAGVRLLLLLLLLLGLSLISASVL